YLNSATATQQLWASITRRFSNKYGPPRNEKPKLINWENSAVKATMEEVSVGKDYGLKLVFEPATKLALATNK
ncbi:hypothetical protein, partial [Aphanothece microscopica]|uniref:hypothetical protein n=1 Tax=Aphanothece microscopica TaxID=1049561 RepID=UPI0039853981